jgi:hypothetical protein
MGGRCFAGAAADRLAVLGPSGNYKLLTARFFHSSRAPQNVPADTTVNRDGFTRRLNAALASSRVTSETRAGYSSR